MILIILAIVAFFMLGGVKTSKAVGKSAEKFGDFLNVKSTSLTDMAVLETIQEQSEMRGQIVDETGCSSAELDKEIKEYRKRCGIK